MPSERPVDGGSGDGKHLGQIADGIIAGLVHPAQLPLLLLGQLGLLAAQIALGPGDGHALSGAQADQVGLELGEGSVSSVHAIARVLDPAMTALAHEGAAAYRDRFELIHRHRGERPNAIWQVDHTELDILVLDAAGRTVRPWLTIVVDDHSRALAGYTVFLGAPSALQTSLALRQAIWSKQDPAWPVCGIPDVLYVDHGSDFTSTHLAQVAADLRFQIVYSAVARLQGRGKVERLFGTLNTELLPELPGHLVRGKPATPPRLSLPELDRAIGAFLVGDYNVRPHGEIGMPPRTSWLADGWLPPCRTGSRISMSFW